MPDTLTNDDIARMIEDVHAHSTVVNGVKRTTVATDALVLVLQELLAARAERDTLRADRDAALEREMRAVRDRDAAVAEAVRQCEQPGCTEEATRLACGRHVLDEYDTTGPRTPGRYCRQHANEVSREHKPEYVATCPHCNCMFGVG